jgi:hypothetical protein
MRRLALVVLLAACRTVAPVVDAPPPPPSPQSIANWDETVRRRLAAERTLLRRCYDDELRRVEEAAVAGAYRDGRTVPPLAGALVLVLPIEPDGVVREPRLEQDTLANPNVAECLLARARGLRFAPTPTREEVEVEVPFLFTLMGSEGG